MTTTKKVEETPTEELPANGPNPVPTRPGLEPVHGEASAYVAPEVPEVPDKNPKPVQHKTA